MEGHKSKNTSPTFIFFGTPALATIVLDELEKKGLLPIHIVTAPDKPSGRGLKMTPSPVKQWAQRHNIPTCEPEVFDTKTITQLENVHADVCVVVAYGKILPQAVLEVTPNGILNVHPSLLPKLRGPSPVRTAILQNHKTVGVTIMCIDEKMDHGPLLVQEAYTPVVWPPNALKLEEHLFVRGGELLADTLTSYIRRALLPTPQDHTNATYCHLFTKKDGLLNLSDDPYNNLLKIHAYAGWPGTYFFDKDGVRIKVLSAHIEDGALCIDMVIPEGKQKMSYTQYSQ